MYTHPPRNDGFTLMELTIAVAIAAILVAVSAPSMKRTWRQANEQRAYHSMSSSLALARIHAITRGHPVTVCPSSDQLTCTGGTDWSKGWLVYLDPTRENLPSTPDAIVESLPALRGGVSMHTSSGRHRIRYRPNGRSPGTNLSLSLCATDTSELAGRIVISNAGRTRIERIDSGLPCPDDP